MAGDALLKIDALNQYYGGSHILRNVALEAASGEVTVILGRNGVGKTTLLKSLMGVVPVRSGSVRFGGADITHDTPYQRVRRGIGYVPQGREIFSRLTVQENLQMGLAYRRGGTALPKSIGAGASGRGDLAERAEEFLAGMGQPAPPLKQRGRR